MSFYNLIHGVNSLQPVLCEILGLSAGTSDESKMDTGRFRDIYLNEDGTIIHLFTRNGGGNRNCWNDDEDNNNSVLCDCPGCIQTYLLKTHPNYISDIDDDFDCTYAITDFSVPEQYLELTKSLATGEAPQTLYEKTMSFTEAFNNSTDELKDGIVNQFLSSLTIIDDNTVIASDTEDKL
jgi:hypothetical protein